jgi:hypothetical protein
LELAVIGKLKLLTSEKRLAAHDADEPFVFSSRGDWTPLELFIGGVRG